MKHKSYHRQKAIPARQKKNTFWDAINGNGWIATLIISAIVMYIQGLEYIALQGKFYILNLDINYYQPNTITFASKILLVLSIVGIGFFCAGMYGVKLNERKTMLGKITVFVIAILILTLLNVILGLLFSYYSLNDIIQIFSYKIIFLVYLVVFILFAVIEIGLISLIGNLYFPHLYKKQHLQHETDNLQIDWENDKKAILMSIGVILSLIYIALFFMGLWTSKLQTKFETIEFEKAQYVVLYKSGEKLVISPYTVDGKDITIHTATNILIDSKNIPLKKQKFDNVNIEK